MSSNQTHIIDKQYLLETLALAEQGKYSCKPNPRVGCVLVKNGEVIGRGWHIKAGQGHAEVNAIADAKANNQSTKGATAYVSLEPCSFTGKTPPCVDALTNAEVSRVVCASLDPNPKVAGKGIKILNERNIQASVFEGKGDDQEVLQKAGYLNRGFFKRMRTGMPWVMLKTASSLDGKIADSNNISQWITSGDARQDVHKLRAESCAIITGSGTQQADNPSLNARLDDFDASHGSIDASVDVKQPYRVLLDSSLKVKATDNIVGDDALLHIFTNNENSAPLNDKAIVHIVKGEINLTQVLEKLAELDVNILMVEAGSILAGAFVEANLVDEIVHYIAPCVIGSQGRDMLDFSKALPLSDKKQFKVSSAEMIGVDTKITYLKN